MILLLTFSHSKVFYKIRSFIINMIIMTIFIVVRMYQPKVLCAVVRESGRAPKIRDSTKYKILGERKFSTVLLKIQWGKSKFRKVPLDEQFELQNLINFANYIADEEARELEEELNQHESSSPSSSSQTCGKVIMKLTRSRSRTPVEQSSKYRRVEQTEDSIGERRHQPMFGPESSWIKNRTMNGKLINSRIWSH